LKNNFSKFSRKSGICFLKWFSKKSKSIFNEFQSSGFPVLDPPLSSDFLQHFFYQFQNPFFEIFLAKSVFGNLYSEIHFYRNLYKIRCQYFLFHFTLDIPCLLDKWCERGKLPISWKFKNSKIFQFFKKTSNFLKKSNFSKKNFQFSKKIDFFQKKFQIISMIFFLLRPCPKRPLWTAETKK